MPASRVPCLLNHVNRNPAITSHPTTAPWLSPGVTLEGEYPHLSSRVAVFMVGFAIAMKKCSLNSSSRKSPYPFEDQWDVLDSSQGSIFPLSRCFSAQGPIFWGG